MRSGIRSYPPVTRGLDHASRIYPTCVTKMPEIEYARFRVVHLLRKNFLRRGWIAGSSPAMTSAVIRCQI
jgi:hypothetical protein